MATQSLGWKSSGSLSEPSDMLAESRSLSSGERRAELDSAGWVPLSALHFSGWDGQIPGGWP